jgi:hypothetical protein
MLLRQCVDPTVFIVGDLPSCNTIAARHPGKFAACDHAKSAVAFLGSVELQFSPKGSGSDPRLCNAPESVGNAAALMAIEQWALVRSHAGGIDCVPRNC